MNIYEFIVNLQKIIYCVVSLFMIKSFFDNLIMVAPNRRQVIFKSDGDTFGSTYCWRNDVVERS